jgi:hypothetical protein
MPPSTDRDRRTAAFFASGNLSSGRLFSHEPADLVHQVQGSRDEEDKDDDRHVLLQTALSLLTLVNANPSLPQSIRDNATAVAQHAISEAHAALASKAISYVAQGTIATTPSTQTVSPAPSSTKAGPAYVYPNPTLT